MKSFKQFVKEAKSPEQEFYNKIYRQAKASGDRFPHLVAAQASLESGYGKSPSGKNNYFGQKATDKEAGTVKGTQEFGGGGYYGTSAKFKDYDDENEAVRTRIKNWSYKYGDAKDDVEAARRLQLPGGAEIPGSKEKSHGAYATSPEYVSSLSSVMNTYRGGVDADEAPKPSQAKSSQAKVTKKKIKFDNV
jgi:flagellum-specific peptidoglycan hydrolase FlgJ